MKSIVSFLAFSFILVYAEAQEVKEKPKINFGAMTQMHFSHTQTDSLENPFGFRIRRVDFRTWSAPTEKFNWSILIGFHDFKFQILEVDVNFKLNNYLDLRIGQFAPPAMRSGAPVDHLFKVPIMTFIERAPITLNWASHSALHAYRTFGVQLHGKLFNDKIYWAAMAGNPVGNNFFFASSKSTNHYNPENGVSLWSRLEYEISKDFVIGGFVNQSDTENDSSSIKRISYGGHILHRKNNLSFMAEFTQGENYIDDFKTRFYRGFFIDGGYRLKNIEPAFRFDIYEPFINSYDEYNVKQYLNYTLGLNYYFSKKIRVQLNYIFKTENMLNDLEQIKNDLFYINLQCLLKP